MARIELTFSALPAHVRTARLVAAAVARRANVDEAIMDEVRLAVGEACLRAVDLHHRLCPEVPVSVTLVDDPTAFRVWVNDCADVSNEPPDDLGSLAETVDIEGGALPSGFGLAVISGLVEDVAVVAVDGGTSVRMAWPTAEPAAF